MDSRGHYSIAAYTVFSMLAACGAVNKTSQRSAPANAADAMQLTAGPAAPLRQIKVWNFTATSTAPANEFVCDAKYVVPLTISQKSAQYHFRGTLNLDGNPGAYNTDVPILNNEFKTAGYVPKDRLNAALFLFVKTADDAIECTKEPVTPATSFATEVAATVKTSVTGICRYGGSSGKYFEADVLDLTQSSPQGDGVFFPKNICNQGFLPGVSLLSTTSVAIPTQDASNFINVRTERDITGMLVSVTGSLNAGDDARIYTTNGTISNLQAVMSGNLLATPFYTFPDYEKVKIVLENMGNSDQTIKVVAYNLALDPNNPVPPNGPSFDQTFSMPAGTQATVTLARPVGGAQIPTALINISSVANQVVAAPSTTPTSL